MERRIIRLSAAVLALVMVLSLFGCSKSEPEVEPSTTETTTKYIPPTNILTGEEISESAKGERPVAIVVENHPDARPQWGIGSADIVCEGEVEGGISRMLWVYSDMSKLPEKIGPLRSARPSFVEFSSFFDAVFVHWGGSHSKGNYTGGYETISNMNIDDLDGMSGGALFSRDKTRKVSSEHTGIINTAELSKTIEGKGYRSTVNEDNVVKFNFNESIASVGESAALGVKVKFSNRTDTRAFTFNSEDKLYHTSDWKSDTAFRNLILLKADSTYITTPYNNSTTTYLNYSWTSGTGVYASNGTYTDISWSVDNGVLSIKDAQGSPITLNVGQSYIGFVSANHEGAVTCTAE